MADILINSLIALRQCILYECVGGIPIFKSYKRLCARLGSDFMSYQEFEFWFMRFSRKEYDLDYDRSQDPKYTEFSDLPNSLLSRIVDEVEPIYRLILRKISRPLRQLLATKNLGFRKISIQSSETEFDVEYDKTCIGYGIPTVEDNEETTGTKTITLDLTGGVEISSRNYHEDDFPDLKSIIEGDVFEIACNDLAIVVGNEQLSLDEFEIGSACPEFKKLFIQTISRQNRKIQTKKLKLLVLDFEKLEFLQFFDVKEEISIQLWTNWEKLPIDKIMGHPGIVDAKMLRVVMPDFTFPPNAILGFPRITIELEPCFSRNGETIEKLRNAILTSASLELFNITCQYGSPDMEEICKLLFPNSVENSQNPEASYIVVLDTGRTLEMAVVEDELHFKRLERNVD